MNDKVQVSDGNTEVKEFKFRYEWTINNFDLLSKNIGDGEFICSTSFSTTTNLDDKLEWCLKLYPKGAPEIVYQLIQNPMDLQIVQHTTRQLTSRHHLPQPRQQNSLFGQAAADITALQNIAQNTEKYVSMKLSLLNGRNEYPITYKISLLNSEPSKNRIIKFRNKFVLGVEVESKNFIPHQRLTSDGFTPDNKLTILCEGRGIVVVNNPRPLYFFQNDNVANEDFITFFENQEFCDFTLSVCGEEIMIHKVILAARSPIFKSMFEQDTEDTKNNRAVIEDIGYDAFSEMLRYIYTGKVLNLEKVAYELLSAANKFALEELKSMCENFMCGNLTVKNVINILKLADLHSSDFMKTAAMNFIKIHFKAVIGTDGWKLLIQENSDLVTQICEVV